MAPYINGTTTPHNVNGSPLLNGAESSPLTVIASSRAVVEGRLTPATIVISRTTGKIVSISESILDKSLFPLDTLYTDHSPKVLLPGLVDAHVHLNEPGRTEWEGFHTGTRAAAFGGVTTVIDMPLNAIPPTTTIHGLREKIAAARGKCWVDVGFYGGIIPGNTHELRPLVRAGVRGFKGFLIDSGVEEFPAVSSQDISAAFEELAAEKTIVMFHAEMIPPITSSVGDDVQTSLPPLQPSGPLAKYQTFLDSRPPSFETYAILEILSLAHLAPQLPLHIVHLSAIEAIPLLRTAREKGVKITAETCFHYLSLVAEEVPDGDTRHKCCPPIREAENRDGLWEELLKIEEEADQPDFTGETGLGGSVIKTVVSDHSPCTPDLKLLPSHVPGAVAGCCSAKKGAAAAVAGQENGEQVESHQDQDTDKGDFFGAWGGISSVGLGLSILWTEATRRGLVSTSTATTASSEAKGEIAKKQEEKMLLNITRWCCAQTASQVGLSHRKGALRVGLDGDVAVFDPHVEFAVQPNTMLFRNKCSPYEGRTLRGVVVETWLRGRRVYSEAEGFGKGGKAEGELLLEPRTV